jgi:hypothetical protein
VHVTDSKCSIAHLNGIESSSFQLGFGPSATVVATVDLWNVTSINGRT